MSAILASRSFVLSVLSACALHVCRGRARLLTVHERSRLLVLAAVIAAAVTTMPLHRPVARKPRVASRHAAADSVVTRFVVREETAFGPRCELQPYGVTVAPSRSVYSALGDLRAEVSNVSGVAIALDPAQVELPIVFRLAQDKKSWEEVETLRCANAGTGNPRFLLPGESMHISLPPGFGEAGGIYTKRGREVAAGTYIVAVRYAPKSWPVLSVPACALSHSLPLQIASGHAGGA